MSHTAKTPPTSNAIADLPDAKDGTVAYDTAAGKPVARINGAWESIAGGVFGTPTVVYDDGAAVGNTDQIQGDIPDNWKSTDSSLKGLVIGTSCTSIGSNAFYYCAGLTGSLVIPDSVTTIGPNAFAQSVFGSGSITSLTIGSGITSIGSAAFYYNANITRIEIYATTAPTIGSDAFLSIPSPAEIHVPAGATGYAASYDGLTVVYDL